MIVNITAVITDVVFHAVDAASLPLVVERDPGLMI